MTLAGFRWPRARDGATRRRLGGACILAALVLGAVACRSSSGDAESVELRVLAGSELADLEPILAEAADVTDVKVQFEFVGTLEGAERVADGDVDDFDALWFPSNRYLSLHPEVRTEIWREERIMTSPVVLGLAPDVARDLGWDEGADVTWSDIADAAEQGQFNYAMTNPATSNSGFSALVGFAAALSGTGAALERDDIEAVAPELEGLLSARELTASSSGYLSDAYVARANGEQPGSAVDGLINYESVLLSLNDDESLPEPLTLIYPTDGVVTADYPLTLLNSASGSERDGYDRLVDHLLTPEVQTDIMEQTDRRPAGAEVAPPERVGPVTLVELPFPARLDVVDALIDAYFNRLRKPVRTVYLLDVSGSMEGERIESLRTALVGLTGAADTLASRAQQFHQREEITLLPFDTVPREPLSFTVPQRGAEEVLADIRTTAENLEADGNTAIYDSLIRAYDLLAPTEETVDDFATSIVLMTDGENNPKDDTGATLEELVGHHEGLPDWLRSVRIFTVVFGDANIEEMQQLSDLTGGRSIDARSEGLETAFREIRDNQ